MSGGLGLRRRDRGTPCLLLGLFAYVRMSGRPVAMEKQWGTVCLARLTFFLARSKGISPAVMSRRPAASSFVPHWGNPDPQIPGRNPKAGRKP